MNTTIQILALAAVALCAGCYASHEVVDAPPTAPLCAIAGGANDGEAVDVAELEPGASATVDPADGWIAITVDGPVGEYGAERAIALDVAVDAVTITCGAAGVDECRAAGGEWRVISAIRDTHGVYEMPACRYAGAHGAISSFGARCVDGSPARMAFHLTECSQVAATAVDAGAVMRHVHGAP